MQSATIYVIEFAGSASVYVGQTDALSRRMRHHLYNLRNGSHVCRPLQRMFDQRGESAISFRRLFDCERRDRHYYERMMARFFGPSRVLNSSLCAPIIHPTRKRFKCSDTGDLFDSAECAAAWLCDRNEIARKAGPELVRRRIAAVARGRDFSYAGTEWAIV